MTQEASADSMPAPRRVLLAEDEAMTRMDLAAILQKGGYEVAGEAGDGRTAVDMARELRPDAAILDIEMPEMDGLQAAEIIIGERICPVLLLTVFSDRHYVDRARDAGVMAYLVKPFHEREIAPALEVAMARYEQQRVLDSEVGDLREKYETRKLLDRAKGILMEQKGLSEADAFRRIQKMSMNTRRPMKDIAQAIIITSDKPAAAAD